MIVVDWGSHLPFNLRSLRRKLEDLTTPLRVRAERMEAKGLAAIYGINTSFSAAAIKNVSSSGIYLITEKQLHNNDLVTLILHEDSSPSNDSELRFSVHARVARQGSDGLGLSFVLPPGTDTKLWGVLLRNIVTLNDPARVAEMFHTLRSILFLCHVCQPESEEPILLLGGQLSEPRLQSLVKIILGAEKILAAQPGFDRRRAEPKLVASLLREGSWASDELRLHLWTGLLVSSCEVDKPGDANQVFVNLLVHVGENEGKIFKYACEHALSSAPASAEPKCVVVTPQDLTDLTSISELARNATTVAYLHTLGLIRVLPDLGTYIPLEEFDITPTTLGLELYKHCQGQRGPVDAELAASATSHIQDLVAEQVEWHSGGLAGE